MPRKAKEIPENEEKIEKVEKKKAIKVSTTAKRVASSSKKTNTLQKSSTASTKKPTTRAKKSTTKVDAIASEVKANAQKETTKKKASVSKETATTKKTTSASKETATTKKATSTPKKTATTKKATSTSKKTATTKKASSTSKKTSTTKKSKTIAKNVVVPEYYDLPYHYNQTVVKVLAQTPKMLFVYWDISNEDRKNYINQFGPDFFNNTMPFLRVKNESSGYSFDIDVDDFANGWYLHVEDSKNDYSIELLRKQRPYVSKVIENPVYISSSNIIETPNDHILFDSNKHTIFYRNVKTGSITSKDIANVTFIKKIGKIYNIYDLYKRIYKNEDIGEVFDLNNPGSGNPTSTFK